MFLKAVLFFTAFVFNFSFLDAVYNKEHLKLVLTSDQKTFEGLNLSGAHLQKANLSGKIFKNTDFRGARLEYANLQNSVFEGCLFRDAIVRGARLKGAGFRGCNLVEVNLSNWVAHIEACDSWLECLPNNIIFDGCSLIGAILDQPEDVQRCSSPNRNFSGNGGPCS